MKERTEERKRTEEKEQKKEKGQKKGRNGPDGACNMLITAILVTDTGACFDE